MLHSGCFSIFSFMVIIHLPHLCITFTGSALFADPDAAKLYRSDGTRIHDTGFLLLCRHGEKILSLCVCPGWCSTELARHVSMPLYKKVPYVARSDHPHDFLQSWGECVLFCSNSIVQTKVCCRTLYQCCGSVTYWYGSGSADPCL